MLVRMKDICDKAYEGKYGVPALPNWNEVQVRATIEAADATNSPVIFLTLNRFPNSKDMMDLIAKLAKETHVPVALCLDHSGSFEDSILGIRNGVTAIMVDRSEKSFEQNVAEVSELERIAHAVDVSIEAELGHVGWGDHFDNNDASLLTDPEDARKFFELTKVDALAVAVGTAHGVYYGEPHIDFERLKDIDAACGKPLVLHGGSGSVDDNISKACTMGITKVNIVTDVFEETLKYIGTADLAGNNVKNLYRACEEATFNFVKHTFEMTGCIGKT